jgi:hypothetical protein
MNSLPIFVYDGLNNRKIGCKDDIRMGMDTPSTTGADFFTDRGNYDPVSAANNSVARLWLPYKDIGVDW